ncbi:uncharacterized protein CTRU02_201446 [Colletotrichum truncatum]|uniref:Uncharacterized protein n=1 Tax=Colletotrichum truncatum TaxID=5467 RepID=A0ACC3ZHB2_COLTU|nr:uncharacterized protein CTRU02_14317 [Colletotrichum truncatum]KAF6782278.1 hypothetical protein CTRU02_14317 [Colletotrichum truncatum]
MHPTAFLFLSAAAGLLGPVAAQVPTETEKSTVWLPPRSTTIGENIYASVITAAPSSTEFLLACTSVFRSASACSHFNNVTLTYGNNTMKIGFRTDTFDCKRDSTATCAVASGNAAASQSTLASSVSASWFTAITIIDGHDKLRKAKARKTSTLAGAAPAATTSANNNGICKRSTKGGSGSGSGGTDAGSDDGADAGSGSSSATKPKTHSDGDAGGCSAASSNFGGLSLVMTGLAAVVGVAVTLFL